MSSLATRLVIDRHQLGGRFEYDSNEENEEKRRQNRIVRLRQRVQHLVMDFRLALVEERLKQIQRNLQQAGSNMELMMALLKEHKETKELRDAIAKHLGSEIIT